MGGFSSENLKIGFFVAKIEDLRIIEVKRENFPFSAVFRRRFSGIVGTNKCQFCPKKCGKWHIFDGFSYVYLGGFAGKNRGDGGNRGEISGGNLGGIPSPRPKPGINVCVGNVCGINVCGIFGNN